MITWGESLLAPGGLLRCGTETLARAIEENPETPCVTGQTIQCRHTPDPMHSVVMTVNGDKAVWKWNRAP